MGRHVRLCGQRAQVVVDPDDHEIHPKSRNGWRNQSNCRKLQATIE